MEIESGQGWRGTPEERGDATAISGRAHQPERNGHPFLELASNLNARGIFYKPKPERLINPPRSVKPK